MSHWAQIDEENKVIQVLVGDNNDPNGDEGYEWLISNIGGKWIQTSYNGTIRKNYAGIGFTYDETLDAFIPPKIYSSWKLDKKTCKWKAPKASPNDGFTYSWNEEILDWELSNFSEVEE